MNFLPEDKRDRDVIAFLTARSGAALKVLDATCSASDWLGRRPADHRRPLLRRLSLLHPSSASTARLPDHRRWLDRDRRPARLEAPLRPDARPPVRPRRRARMTDAYIYDAIRTPRGKGRPDGALHEVTALRLSADTLNALKARNGPATDAVEDVIWGNVTQVGEQGGCLARSAVLASDLDRAGPRPLHQPLLRQRARGGEPRRQPGRGGAGAGYVAGGVEMMGRVPMGSDGAAIAVDPVARHEDLLRAAGHQRRHHRHRVRLLPRRRRRLRRREPEARRGAPGPTAASPARSCR